MRSEGARRLGIACGGLAAFGWIIFVAISSEGFAYIRPMGWFLLVVGVPVSFGLGYLTVWAIQWVIEGYKVDRRR